MAGDLQIVTTTEVEQRMILVRNQQVLLDRDVAALYGVETKRINEAVKTIQISFLKDMFWSLLLKMLVRFKQVMKLRSKISTANLSVI